MFYIFIIYICASMYLAQQFLPRRYVETPKNPLKYWGLDYPPLSAYQSWFHGQMLDYIHPEAVALESSRGTPSESDTTRTLMRLTVLLSDIVFFLPLLWLHYNAEVRHFSTLANT